MKQIPLFEIYYIGKRNLILIKSFVDLIEIFISSGM